MDDKNKFQEMLGDILEVARVQGNQLETSEIKSLFGNMNLSEAQYEHIFAYLAAHQIKIKGYVESISDYTKAVLKDSQRDSLWEENKDVESEIAADTGKEEKSSDAKKLSKGDSAYLKMYLEDLEAITQLCPNEEEKLIEQIRQGDSTAKNRFIEINLKKVVNYAMEYQNRGVILEDLIQEGNIGLMTSLEVLADLSEKGQEKEFVEGYITEFMKLFIEEQKQSSHFEERIIDKIAYIRDSVKDLEEELGREVNINELAKHVKLTKEEVVDILNMSVDAIRVSHNHQGSEGEANNSKE